MSPKEASLYVQLNAYRYRLERTKRFIAESLAKVNNPYVACSFGKDSSVMLHLVLEQCPDIAVKFLAKIETSLIDDYDSIIAWWETKYPNLHIERIVYTGWLEDPTAKTGIAQNVTDSGFDAFFVGLRIEESFGRRVSLKKYGLFHKLANEKTRIAPLADWSTRDIAAYMVHNDLPILKAYQREGFEARTTSNIPSKYPHESLARLKDANPSAFNQLLQLLPDARNFI